ncbi:MAG TPA: hypothetical protein VKV35_06245 [Streptosporangiaceae bacterium]|nr:hypothetical protein [Streptosporangiaceae bacterium]
MARVTGAPPELSGLAAEFPGYEFATQRTRGGIAIVARRHGGCARPGLYAVVTGDLDEMRRALAEHERPACTAATRREGRSRCSRPGPDGEHAPGWRQPRSP